MGKEILSKYSLVQPNEGRGNPSYMCVFGIHPMDEEFSYPFLYTIHALNLISIGVGAMCLMCFVNIKKSVFFMLPCAQSY